ncbi:MAG: hypothetical protein M1827_006926 [Pycnora praestabilis]|nr:MAG: hypothetical protein M1827_006926 [Pycnora praestabilis]
MAYTQSMYYRPPVTSLDMKHKFFEEDDAEILDENILDSSTFEMSPMSGHRRDSLADTASLFSSKDGVWGDMHMADRHSNTATNPFFEHSNNPFRGAQGAYAQQSNNWAMDPDSGASTPTAGYEGFPTEFDGSAPGSYLASSGGATGAVPFGGLPIMNHIRPGPLYPTATSTNSSIPASPHSAKDWMSMASSDHLEPRSLPKRMRPTSPSSRSHSPLMRRDGIRKKNARFEIPAERNLYNIDQLISQSNDDQEIKELKQQKRLLRNRQAALDSRQRKKQHTEKLEEEKKQYTNAMADLEEALQDMKIREDQWLLEKEQWNVSQEQYQQYIDSLRMEKEEMVRSHTLETGDLRKKNAFLTEHIQKMESTAMSAVPSSSGFSTDFSDIDSITMEGSAWDNLSFVNDFSVDPEARPENSLIIPPRKIEKISSKDNDKPAASGLLLMLLLCGAFVASRSSTATPAIPRMSDDIRQASATVLDSIFKDAGVQPSDPPLNTANRVEALEPAPSGTSWPLMDKTTLTADEMAGISGSSLEALNHQLIAPTKQQQQEQIFSLSADQYNGVTSQDFLREPEPTSTSQHRRNLGESLAAMRSNHKESAAEVYTRSLMWDKIPTEVVRDFAKMVSECNAMNEEHHSADAYP